jgi:hypothetical protein
MTCFFNDGSSDAPKLNVYLNVDTLVDLLADSIWPGAQGLACHQQLATDGFEGIQLTTDDPPVTGSPLPHCGTARINLPTDAHSIAALHALRGDNCITVHVGWGMENDDQVSRLVEAILTASHKHQLPIFIETHRATITQDLWRTVQITKKFPEIRFNADFSHYYCGQELVYGECATKLEFMLPIFERVGSMHGRIASSGSVQVPIGDDLHAIPPQARGRINFLEHFKELWTNAMFGFLTAARPGDVPIFTPELLSSRNYYARTSRYLRKIRRRVRSSCRGAALSQAGPRMFRRGATPSLKESDNALPGDRGRFSGNGASEK